MEFGVGHFSTPLLHAYCVSLDRRLFSVESDGAWMQQFKKLEGPLHKFVALDQAQELFERYWSVAFLDQSREAMTRAASFTKLIHSADFVVVHDYHRENEDEIAPLLHGLNYHVTRHQEPPTLVASSSLPIPLGVVDL